MEYTVYKVYMCCIVYTGLKAPYYIRYIIFYFINYYYHLVTLFESSSVREFRKLETNIKYNLTTESVTFMV